MSGRRRCALLLLLAVAPVLAGVRSLQAAETLYLEVPQVAQRFAPALPSGTTKDAGNYNCLPASVAMLLQTKTVQERLPAGAITDYMEVRRRFRERSPNANKGIDPGLATDLLPALSGGMLSATAGYPAAGDQAQFAQNWKTFLRDRLRQGLPVIVIVMDWRRLDGRAADGRQVHAIIVAGMTDDKVTYNDPWDGRSHVMEASRFALAWNTPQPGTDIRWVSVDIGWSNTQARSTVTASPPATVHTPIVTAQPVTATRTATVVPATATRTPTSAVTVTAPPAPSRSPAAGRLAVRLPSGQLVLHDPGTGRQEVLPSPAPDSDFIVSADLSTFAWLTPKRGAAASTTPLTLHVHRTVRGTTQRSQIDLSAHLRRLTANRTDGQYLSVTLSPDGSRALIGPLSIGASGRMFGVMMIATADGAAIDVAVPRLASPLESFLQWCSLYEGAIAPNNLLIAGPTMQAGSPGAGGFAIGGGVCSASPSAEDLAAARSLDARFEKSGAHAPRDVAWSVDGRSIVFAQSDQQGGRFIETISILTAAGTRAVYSTSTEPVAGLARLLLASPSLSNDGAQIAYEVRHRQGQGTVFVSEVWLMGADGSAPRKIADGSAPFWVRPAR